jgi:thioredoxin-related protein
MKHMKKIILGFALLLSLFSYAQNLKVGAEIPMPDEKMMDVSGAMTSISDAKSKAGVLVIFSCNTCPFVIKNQSRMLAVCKWARANNYGVIVINSNEAERNADDSYISMQAYAKAQGYAWSYVVDKDSKLADAFGAMRTPECFLFNTAGKLVYHGAIDDNPSDAANVKREHLKIAMEETLEGKTVTMNFSRSVGCTIKRS